MARKQRQEWKDSKGKGRTEKARKEKQERKNKK